MKIEVLADGYQLVEAPRVDDDGNVWFTDVLGGGVHRWSRAERSVETIVPKRRGVGGLALHADGGVVVSGRDITHVQPDGTNRLLFAPPEGVTGFNDISATADGTVLAGGLRFMPFAGDEVVPGAFWHISSAETSEVVLEDVAWPNGVGDDGERLELLRLPPRDGHVGARVTASGACWRRRAAKRMVSPSTTTAGSGSRSPGTTRSCASTGTALCPRRSTSKRTSPRASRSTATRCTSRRSPATTTSGALLRVDAGVSGPRHRLATI